MRFLFAGLVLALCWLVYSYGIAIGYIEELKANPLVITEHVAVNEVPIPQVYNAKELNDYCKYEWSALHEN